MINQKKKLLVLDFDNTLFDWVAVWHRCFTSMMDKVTATSGIPLADMAEDIRLIHRRNRTSEYSFLLEEIPALQPMLSGSDVMTIFGDAVDAFRTSRRETLKLYPSVAETLLGIKGNGTRIAIYTESLSYYSFYRLKRLGLDGVVDVIYTPPDHDLPDGLEIERLRSYESDFYKFRHTEQRHTPLGELKPNCDILAQIIRDFGVLSEETAYVGDSLHKDIAMAQDAGVDCAWAKYGQAQDSEAYKLLEQVTHWTDEDMIREKEIRSREVLVDHVLENSLSEIRDHFIFTDFSK